MSTVLIGVACLVIGTVIGVIGFYWFGMHILKKTGWTGFANFLGEIIAKDYLASKD